MSFELAENDALGVKQSPTLRLFGAIAASLHVSWFGYLARIVLTFMFWSSGLAKLLDFDAGLAEMRHFGLVPEIPFYLATVITVLGGSLLIILDRWTWLGAGALALFTILTIPIAHNFWTMEEPLKTMEFHEVMEHITVVGAMLFVISASATRKARTSGGGLSA